MNFRRGRGREEPEINFIPLIDVLLVILIFLMVTTTYAHFSELKINLPAASAQAAEQKSDEIEVAVAANGQLMVAQRRLSGDDANTLISALKEAAAGKKEPVVVINADKQATHQSVVSVMQAAQAAGLSQLTFATSVKSQ
jgi:biopolymer transport protein ExbD